MKFFKRLLYTLLLTFGFIYMGYIFCTQQIKLNDLNKEIAFYDRELQEQNVKTQELNNRINSMSSNKYMEEVARERLGYVMPDEIIFIDASI